MNLCPNPDCENGLIRGTKVGCCICEGRAESVSGEPPRAEPPLKCAICGFGIYFDLGAWRHKATGDRACRSNPEDGIAQPFLGGSRPSAPTHTYVGNGEVPCFECSRPLSDEIHAAPAPKSDLVDEALILYVNEWQDVDFLFSDRTLDAQKVCEFAAAFAAHLRGK